MAMVCKDKGGRVRNRILDFRIEIEIEIRLESLRNQDIMNKGEYENLEESDSQVK